MTITIGKQLKQMRENNGMTQQELAQKIGVTQALIARYEKNAKVPSLPVTIMIADVFNCSIDTLVDRRCS